PRIPRGTSWSGPGLTSFMRTALPRSLSRARSDAQIVVQPLRALSADAVVERLRACVVERGLPGQRDGAVRAAALGARGDELLADAAAAGVGRDEQVVHHADPLPARRGPRPEHRGEPDRG